MAKRYHKKCSGSCPAPDCLNSMCFYTSAPHPSGAGYIGALTSLHLDMYCCAIVMDDIAKLRINLATSGTHVELSKNSRCLGMVLCLQTSTL